jgi:uncharacterized membrane protein
MLTAGSWFCVTTPLFKVPDEDAHIFRADQVSQGHFLAWKAEPNRGGGLVDQGYADLILFVRGLSAKQGEWFSAEDIEKIRSFRAVGQRSIQGFNSASYFAGSYLPQAAGLLTARLFTDRAAYHVVASRIANLLAFVAILTAALWAFPSLAPAFLCLSLMPMVLFLASSASQDALITAIAALSAGLYLQIFIKRPAGPDRRSSPAMRSLIGCAACLLFISLSRPVFFPFLVLLPVAALVLREKRLFTLSLALCAVAALCIAAQLYYVSSLGVPSGKAGVNPQLQMDFILSQPLEYAGIILETWRQQSYPLVSSLMGILGLLDQWLSGDAYASLKTFVAIAVVFQFIAFMKQDWSRRLGFGCNLGMLLGALLLACCAATLLTFTSMYLLWNLPRAALIEGMQGRYFYVPAVMLTTIGLGALAAGARNAFRRPQNVQFFDPTLISYVVFLPGIVTSQILVASIVLTYYR